MLVTSAKAKEAAEILGVSLDGLTPIIVRAAYRSKAKECHPDKHGTTKLEQWSRISWAKEVLTRWLEKQPELTPPVALGDCAACEGTGRIKLRSSNFNSSLSVFCAMCGGSGCVAEVTTPERGD